MNLIRSLKTEVQTWRSLIRKRLYIAPKTERAIIEAFHRLYFESSNFGQTFGDTRWMGTPALKCPLDLWVYQEILYAQKPDVVIETGTAHGGSALYMASLMDLWGYGEVITIDIEHRGDRPQHSRIRYLTGSSIAPEILRTVGDAIRGKKKVMVILDSDHRKNHVLDELRAYHSLVTPGSYLIVEDTNMNGHPVNWENGPGPMEAIAEFQKENRDFRVDPTKEKFLLTFNPRGFLIRNGGQ